MLVMVGRLICNNLAHCIFDEGSLFEIWWIGLQYFNAWWQTNDIEKCIFFISSSEVIICLFYAIYFGADINDLWQLYDHDIFSPITDYIVYFIAYC